MNEFWQNMLLFSHSVVSHSLWFHGLQHTRFPCPSISPGFAPTHVHWVGDAIRSSHPLLSPSPPAFVFPSISIFFTELALHVRGPKYWSFSNIQGWFPLTLTGLISLQSKGLSKGFSNTTVQKHGFFSTQPSLWSNSHIHKWRLEKP